ncbi:TPA: hypothetical protein ACF4E7_004518 [Vibrio parahaemolyticus]|nr:hypothetical protein [Vibrio parahaemolyticus]HCE1970488.1 hypothetical protein [Vibrio parahaemolyticus]
MKTTWLRDYWITLISTVGLGVISFLVGVKFSSVDAYLIASISMISTLFCLLVFHITRGLNSIDRRLTTQSKITRLLESIIDREPELTKDSINTIVKRGHYSISKADIPAAWIDLSWGISNEYIAVNYEKAAEAYKDKTEEEIQEYKNNWSDTGIDIQNLKVSSGQASIQKLFVVDKREELGQHPLSKVIEQHRKVGITIRYIVRSKIDESEELCYVMSRISSLDFSIVDNSFVFIWNLDEKRVSKSAQILFSKEQVKTYKQVYKVILRESCIYHGAQVLSAS